MAYTDIDKPSDYFNTKLYTGNGSTQSISDLNFSPDLVWIKQRNGTRYHRLIDSVRGATKELYSNSTDSEITVADGLTSFDSNGFTLGSGIASNGSGDTFVGWSWRGSDSSAVSNTVGSITSTVSANTTSGFSIVSFTVPSSGTFTVGHGLTVKPDLIITKGRGSADNWVVYHKSISSSNEDDYINLNTTDATSTITDIWGTAQPTSTVVGMNAGQTLIGSQNAIAYCFAEKKGFSKFGSYTGNGNADGPFIYTGFKPAFVIIKASGFSGTDWQMYDNKRNTYNSTNNYLRPNLSNAEATGDDIDFLSNGFKIKTSSGWINNNTYENIYMAFAESPFTTSTGIPTTAR